MGVRHLFGFRLGADRISASTNSSAEFRRQAHFRLQAGGRPNFSFNEFERRISASGTFSASGWWPTEFQLQRIRAPTFGVRHIFGFRLGADRISASANSSAEFRRQAHFRLQAGGRPNFSFNEFERRISASGTFSASGWWPTEFQLQRIRAPNFGVRHIFGFRLGADRISASANSSAEFRRQAHFRLQAGGRPNFSFNEFERRISASGTFSASGWGPTEFRLQRIQAPTFGVRHIFGFRPNLGFSAEFRRQDHFRLQSLAGSNIGAEFERQPIFGFSQHRPNLGAEFRLQNLSFRGGTKPGGSGEGCLWACWCCAFRKTAKPAASRTSPWWLWCNARVRVGTSASDRRGSVSSRSPIFDFPLAPYASRRLVMASPHAAPKASAADLAADFFEAADLTWASEPPAAPGPTSTSTPMASSPMEVEQPVVGDLGVRNRSRPRRARGSWEVSNPSQQRRRLRWANRI